jgi:hypothetical protein
VHYNLFKLSLYIYNLTPLSFSFYSFYINIQKLSPSTPVTTFHFVQEIQRISIPKKRTELQEEYQEELQITQPHLALRLATQYFDPIELR